VESTVKLTIMRLPRLNRYPPSPFPLDSCFAGGGEERTAASCREVRRIGCMIVMTIPARVIVLGRRLLDKLLH
jgi:hypothetical protein